MLYWRKVVFCTWLVNLAGHSLSNAEEQTVIEERTACLYHGYLTLTCPKDYIVVLRRAQYFMSHSRGCKPNDESLCEMESITQDHLYKCLSLDSCKIPLKVPDSNSINKCTGYNGDPFLKVTYLCEPFMKTSYDKNVKYMCDFGPSVWSGSLLYLWSPMFPKYSNQNTDCGCTISVKPGIEMEIKIPHFQPPAEEIDAVRAEGCTQVIDVQSGYKRQTICSINADSFNTLDLDVRKLEPNFDNNIYIHFKNPNRHNIRFWIAIQVHHYHNFTMTCQKNFQMPILQTTLTPTTTKENSPQSSQEPTGQPVLSQPKDAMQSHWPIVTGVVAAVCFGLVISVALLLFCRRRQKNKILRQKGASEINNYTYQNSVYMTHSQVSGHPGSNLSSNCSNISSQHQQQTEVNIEIVGRNSGSTISIRSSSTSNTLPPKPGMDQPSGVETIPNAVLDRLGFQSEATLKTSHLAQGTTAAAAAKRKPMKLPKEEPKVDDNEDTPYSSMTDLSVKDLAKLMEHQLQGNKK